MIGGGPAGLEAARACAERGHEVTLLEAADQLGGQVLSPPEPHATPKRQVSHTEIRRLGVTVRLNCYADPADVLALQPDVVVVATGGYPDTAVLESGKELVVSTWDVLSQAPKPGRRVWIFDEHRGD